MRITLLLAGVVALGGCRSAGARVATAPAANTALDSAILAMDDSMTATFNRHDADALMALFASDVEFYHDVQGLQDYAAVSAGFHHLLAGGSDIRRQRVGALEVYPIPGYGALEVGAHQFCHTERGRQDCGTFRFVQVWKHAGAGWKIARVMSYGH